MVTVTVNGHDYTTTVQNNGTYSVDVATSDLVADNSVDVSVASTDSTGNSVTSSATHTISVDTTISTPEIEMNISEAKLVTKEKDNDKDKHEEDKHHDDEHKHHGDDEHKHHGDDEHKHHGDDNNDNDSSNFDDSSSSEYHYDITLNASIPDAEDSETLSSIKIDNIPDGAKVQDADGNDLSANSDGSYTVSTNDNGEATVTIVSENELDSESLNGIKASVTATDSDTDQSITNTIDANGLDELTYDGNADIDLSVLADNDKLEDLSKITLQEGKQNITLSIEDVLDVTGEDNTLVIQGDEFDSVTLEGDWANTGTATVDGNEFNVYEADIDGSSANVLIDINQNNIHIDES